MIARYRSKIDIWLVVVVWAATLLPSLNLIIRERPIALIVIDALVIVSLTALLMSISYEIEGEKLTVRYCYLFRETFKVADITEIRKTRTLLSAPAASLDRLELRIWRKLLIISPRRHAEFVARLLTVNPDIKCDGATD